MDCCGLCCGLRLWVVSCVEGVGSPSLFGECGLIDSVGGDIEWVVASRGHEGPVDYPCLEKRDTQRKRETCLVEEKK